jgi:Tol biopolymer transport system component
MTPRRKIVIGVAAVAVLAGGVTVVATRHPKRDDRLVTITDDEPTPTTIASPETQSDESPTPDPSDPPATKTGSDAAPKDPEIRQPSLSSNAGLIAFRSDDPLFGGDTNGVADIYVRNRSTHSTSRISVSSDGDEANGPSGNPAISADGSKIAFISLASNLVDRDTNDVADTFVRDLVAHTTVRVSVSSTGVQGNRASGSPYFPKDRRHDFSYAPSISADGRYVAFESSASDLVPRDDNGDSDVFVHDLKTGSTVAASVASDGSTGDAASENPSISANGMLVGFDSKAGDLADGSDSSTSTYDVFVRDLASDRTTLASVSSDGKRLEGSNRYGSLSGSGRFIAFVTVPPLGSDGSRQDAVMRRDLQTGETASIQFCGEDVCQGVVLSSDGSVAGYIKAIGGLDGFCYLVPRNARGYVSYCGTGWITLSPDGRYVGMDAWVDALSDPKDEQRFGGHHGAMIYDRSTDTYSAAWLI